jgi:membrane associated rhomboid family serine protease
MPDISSRRRSSGPAWLRPLTNRLTPTVKALIIADTVIYLFFVVVRESRAFIVTHLALTERFFGGELWQPVTSLFVHLDFLGFLFGMIGLWFVGSFIEKTQGTRRCAGLFFAAGVLANLAIAGTFRALRADALVYDDGTSFGTLALFVAFGRLYGRQPAQVWPIPISIQARYLVMILIGFMVASFLTRGDWPHLVGLAVAILVGYFGAAGGGLAELRSSLAHARDLVKARRLRRRFGVIDGGGRRSKKYVN